MRFDQPLIKLPVRFCADTLAAEVRALPASAWVPHPQRFPGNEAVPLITPAGQLTDDFAGPMKPTENLLRCRYMMEGMAELGAVWGRGRLMGLGPGGEVPGHVDTNYYWRTHIRVHIPVLTNPQVEFTCGGQSVHMAAGECWVLDTFQEHQVANKGSEQRVHIVLDTVGGERLWDLIDAAQQDGVADAALIEPGNGSGGRLLFEQHNFPKVMSAWELSVHINDLVARSKPDPVLDQVRRRLDRLIASWTAAWAVHGDSDAGLFTYRALLDSCRRDLQIMGAQAVMLDNDRQLFKLLNAFVFDNAVMAERYEQSLTRAATAEKRLAS